MLPEVWVNSQDHRANCRADAHAAGGGHKQERVQSVCFTRGTKYEEQRQTFEDILLKKAMKKMKDQKFVQITRQLIEGTGYNSIDVNCLQVI